MIWTYLESPPTPGAQPGYFELCRRTVERTNPDSAFVTLTPANLEHYIGPLPAFLDDLLIDEDEHIGKSVRTSFVSAQVLSKHGGVWIDPGCIATASFDDLFAAVDKRGLTVVDLGRKRTPRYSNRLIGARANNSIVDRYAKRLTTILESWDGGERNPLGGVAGRLLSDVLSEQSKHTFVSLDKRLHAHLDEEHQERLGRVDFNQEYVNDLALRQTIMLSENALCDNFGRITPEELLWSPTLLGTIFRRVLQPSPEAKKAPSAGRRTPETGYGDIALIFTTIRRPQACIDFVESVRRLWPPEIGIYISVQGDPLEQFQEMAERHNVNLFSVPEDYGLAASRNYVLDRSNEPVILLGDDDFVVSDKTRLDVAMDIWNSNSGIKFLGGMFDNFQYDVDGNLSTRMFFGFENLLVRHRFIPKSTILYPSQYYSPELYYIDEDHYFHFADTVNNFALMDRAYMAEIGLRWDDDMVIGGEHTDFYLQLQELKDPEQEVVAFTNALVIEHQRRITAEYISLRRRKEFYIKGLRKWNDSSWFTIGKYIHQSVGVDDLETVSHP